jgi:hypothetical protein
VGMWGALTSVRISAKRQKAKKIAKSILVVGCAGPRRELSKGSYYCAVGDAQRVWVVGVGGKSAIADDVAKIEVAVRCIRLVDLGAQLF